MADVNKTVEISLKANLSNLEKGLKQLPGMTEKEARKMTQALAQELKKTQREAKKAAAANKRATRQMEIGFKRAGNAAKSARVQSRNLGAALGGLEDVVGTINPELAGLATEIGMAGQAFRTLSRSLATGNPILIGVVATLALAAGAYTLFTSEARKAKEEFEKFEKEADKSKEAVKNLSQEVEALNKQFSLLGIGALATYDMIGDAENALLLAQGKISESEFARRELGSEIFKRNQSITNEFLKQNQLLDQSEQKAKDSLSILRDSDLIVRQRLDKLREEGRLASEEGVKLEKRHKENQVEEKRLLDLLEEQKDSRKDLRTSYDQAQQNAKELAKVERRILKQQQANEASKKAVAKEEERSQDFLSKAEQLNKTIVEIERESEKLRVSQLTQQEQIQEKAEQQRQSADDRLLLLQAQADVLSAEAKTEEEKFLAQERHSEVEKFALETAKMKKMITEEEERLLSELVSKKKEQSIIEKELLEMSKTRDQIEKNVVMMALDTLAATDERLAAETKLLMQKEEMIDKINREAEALLDKAKTQEEIDLIENERRLTLRAAEEEHALKMDSLREAMHKKEMSRMFGATQVLLGGLGDMATNSLALLEQVGSENKEMINALFFAQKAVALSEIVFNTAKAITAAGQFGAFAPVAIAGYVATAAAQSAMVMAQKPPKFHMGGMMESTPDERVVIVKSGEAILDRATVNQLGGSQGVRDLRSSGNDPRVIVMNPYKHFDRFMIDRNKNGISGGRARKGY